MPSSPAPICLSEEVSPALLDGADDDDAVLPWRHIAPSFNRGSRGNGGVPCFSPRQSSAGLHGIKPEMESVSKGPDRLGTAAPDAVVEEAAAGPMSWRSRCGGAAATGFVPSGGNDHQVFALFPVEMTRRRPPVMRKPADEGNGGAPNTAVAVVGRNMILAASRRGDAGSK